MDQENGHPASEVKFEPFGRGSGYRSFGFLAVLGMMYGIVVASVLSTSPTAITIVKYVTPVFGVVGIVAGAWYGFFFNISNHCTGGRLLCGIIVGLGLAAVGTLVVSLVTVIVGTVAGFAAGWIVGSFLRSKRQGEALLIGAGVAQDVLDLLLEYVEMNAPHSYQDDIEDHFWVKKIESGKLWLEPLTMLDEVIGPVPVPKEVT